MSDSFAGISYLAQVRRLRELAKVALNRYDLNVKKIDFLRHGENATFCVHAKDGRKYLLRILRGGYHTDRAADAELRWLVHLSKKGFAVPKPVRAKNGDYSVFVKSEHIANGRRCCLFEWLDGSFIEKSLNEQHMHDVGALLARLQKEVPAGVSKHRRYWTADGLVGRDPKFGSIENLVGVSEKNQRIISKARAIVHAKLKRFEKRNPKKLGMIHADLHFSNLLVNRGRIAAIDFDDSGYGFYVYDLIIPLQSAEHTIGPKRRKELPKLKSALIKGYSKYAAWDAEDEAMMPYMLSARRLAMLGWLNSRSDNPRLRKYLKTSAPKVAKRLKELYLS